MEKFGPRRLIAIGTVMAGMSWVLSAQVNGLATLWLVYGCMGGLGTGIVYIGVVGLMVKWFPQQRGFAAGAVAAGYGMWAIITTFPISLSLTNNGLEHTMTTFGILFALVGFLASQGLKLPPPAVFPGNAAPAAVLADVRHDGDDVDFRADGHFADGGVRRGFRH